MKLIVGLGNPGKQYSKTRHNVGFMFIDEVVDKLKGKFLIDKQKKCQLFQTIINGEKVIFMKPLTYMNLSGQAVYEVSKFFKVDIEDILVIYDDLDLEVGRIKIKPAGTSGGHNGIKSIIENLQTNDIKRVRIGIAKAENKEVIDYVLGNFSKQEKKDIDIAIEKGYDIVMDYIHYDFDRVMNTYN